MPSSARVPFHLLGSRAIADAIFGPEEIPDAARRVRSENLADRVAFGGAMIAQMPSCGPVRDGARKLNGIAFGREARLPECHE